ncbi:hypothetical protein OVO55_11455, partial [Streptococcus pneumoniae]|nr:hypothetical protein [Streptococcus pneumoniae]
MELQRKHRLGQSGRHNTLGLGAVQPTAGREASSEEDDRPFTSAYLAGGAGCEGGIGWAGDV